MFIAPHTLPQLAAWLLILSLAWLYISPFTFLTIFNPLINSIYPPASDLISSLHKIPLCIALTIHVGESVFFLKPLLDKKRINAKDRVLWVLCHLVEGYTAIKRLRDEVS